MRVLCAVLLSMLVGALAATQCNPSGSRQDCGYVGITQQQCEAKQCCWTPTNGLPWCYSANGPADTSSYQVVGESKRQNGITLNLKLSHGTAIHGADISQLVLDATFETRDRIRVRITDPQNKRYEIPQTLLPDPESEELKTLDVLNYEFSYTSNPFGFAVTRKSDSEVLFNTTTSKGFVFENQFLQISTALPENPNVYGFAERIDNLKLDLNKMYTMWSYDIPTPDHQNLYGVHPFYMEVRNGKAHSVFLKNSNAQEVYLESGMLTYFVTGGILDFYIMVGPSPDQATQQYHDVVGHPHMPPFWSLGWHQCRYGFKDLDEIKQVVKSYKDNNIPLDTIWADIDHMDAYKDFTWDPVNFPQSSVAEFVNTLHSENQKMVVIVDPGIHNVAGYAAYEDGLQKDLFIKRANGDVFIGKVWPGTTAFPDFTHPNTTDYWYGLIKEFLDKTPLDGLWIDMNEISNFCNGYCASEDLVNMIAISADGFDPNNPPYRINNANHQGPLNEKTLDMDCLHYNGELEYNLHTLFGHSEGIATKLALEKYYGKRSFILSRSTFAGSGKHVAHWLGDNHASFKSMQGSFPGALLFNILGIPLVGSDICGFMENANEELCNRWHSVGAFYPFARNHQALGTNFKYPYMWESVKEASIKSLNVRYSLLHYYYTLFYNAYVSGGTVMRPLFYEFPDESATMGIDQQFMIGPALLFSPCMVEGAVTVNAYFPKAKWYDYWTKKEVPTTYQGTSQTLSVPWSTIPIYYRGGYIVPSQTPALTSVETKANPFTFTVALDENNRAVGDLYVDDGEDLSVGAKSFKASLVAKNNAFSVEVLSNTYESVHELLVESVVVLGVSSAPSSVVVDGKTTAFKYDAESKVLSITGLNTSLDQFKSASWGGAEEIVIE